MRRIDLFRRKNKVAEPKSNRHAGTDAISALNSAVFMAQSLFSWTE
jgi:hypothetical protein